MDLIVAKFDGNALKNGTRIIDASKSAVIYRYPAIGNTFSKIAVEIIITNLNYLLLKPSVLMSNVFHLKYSF